MKKRIVFVAALVALVVQVVSAGHHEKSGSVFQTVLLQKQDFSAGRLMDLANAFSEEGFEWRPAEGIRSVKEVVSHAAAGNYFLSTKLGADLPEGIDPFALEKTIASKAEALAVFESSLTFIREVVASLPEEDLETKLDFFGNEVNKLFIVLQWSDHTNEHLGQLIAYARSSGVVPPWSQ